MYIEHLGINVPNPREMAAWYCANLDMKIMRSFDQPPYAHFLADSQGRGMIEIYANLKAPIPDYPSIDPLSLHICLGVPDVAAARARLIAAGATPLGEVAHTSSGDTLAMLRDPWGVPVQLACRGVPMI